MEQVMASTTQPSANIESNSCDPPSSSEPVASSSKESEPEPAPKPSKPHSRVGNLQPSVAYLKRLGIKVRDFAYESTLPPVPTYYLQKRQIQPDTRRPLQRTSTEPDDGSQQPSQGTQNLGRRPTEPVITPERPLRMGLGAFANLVDELDYSQQSNLHTDSPSNSQAPSTFPESHQSTADTTMHSTTAEASHTWNTGNTSNPHPSQLRMDSGAAGSESGSLPHSQSIEELRHDEAPSSSSRAFTMSFPSSPLTPIPSSPTSSPPNGIRVTPLSLSNQLSSTLRSNSTYELRSPGTPRVLATSTRYFLRKRPSPSSSVTSPNSRPSKRARKFPAPESPLQLTRTNSTSAKSSHSQKKSRDKSSSSASRTLRNSVVGEGKGKRKKS